MQGQRVNKTVTCIILSDVGAESLPLTLFHGHQLGLTIQFLLYELLYKERLSGSRKLWFVLLFLWNIFLKLNQEYKNIICSIL